MECKKGRTKPLDTHQSNPNFIPEHLIMDQILPRLPIKSLARFKSVSKNWNSHISFNSFNPKSPPKIIIHSTKDDVDSTIFMLKVEDQQQISFHGYQLPNIEGRYIQVIGSSNGLICIRATSFNSQRQFFLICNPITQECRLIRGPYYRVSTHFRCYNGFVYDSSSNDYKLLLVGKYCQSVHLFSLKEFKWRKIKMFRGFLDLQPLLSFEPVLVGETLHWLRRDSHKGCSVLAFDSGKESFSSAPLPFMEEVYEKVSGRDLFLCNVRDCLCVCWMRTRGFEIEPSLDETFDLEVWILEEYGVWDSWKILFTVSNLQEFFKRKSAIYSKLFELRNHGSCKTGNLFSLLGKSGGLLMINSHGGAHYHNTESHGLPFYCGNSMSAFMYVESLVSPFYCGKRQLSRKAKEGKKNYRHLR